MSYKKLLRSMTKPTKTDEQRKTDFENRLRIEGKYQDWMNDKVRTNKLSWIKDQKASIKEWMKQQK